MNIGYWTNARDAARWKITVPEDKAGRYTAQVEYSCQPGSGGSTYELQIDGTASGVGGTVAATASWSDYQTNLLAGTLTLSAGAHTLRVVPLTKPGLAVMNLRRILLTPIAR